MARPIHPNLSPVVERVFSAIDRTFGIPERIYYDNSNEVCSLGTLDAFLRAHVDLIYGELRQHPGKDTDA
ncbi:hypothetical protein ACQ86E_31070 [Bradyrhizobium betae]|uniref:hypothetical protein n=1 Tax=Bradyrhizobium betae TaxID=244734 RepID=UPI003D676017